MHVRLMCKGITVYFYRNVSSVIKFTSLYFSSSFKTKDLYVRVGSSNAARGGQNVKISKIIIHEQFQTDFPYDVALIKTARPIKLSTRARPIKLASTAVGAGAEANVTGFGETLVS